jgi:putative nucleotidyltransferase with HDIG domain
VHQNAAPIREESGEISGIVLAFSDITRSKRAEEELKKSWVKQKSAMEGTVQAMAYTIETRDPYTAGHQRRVTKLACAIAEEMRLSENQMEGVRLAGGLHDLGKIYVPAEILAKPGKLTPVEYSIIKTHPQVGYDILKSIEFPWPIADFVLQHHERIDGSGYPNGLKEDKIFMEARILAVADVIEAMATHRPYRAALTIEAALDEIQSNRGDKYDSLVVDACLAVFEKKKFDFDKF